METLTSTKWKYTFYTILWMSQLPDREFVLGDGGKFDNVCITSLNLIHKIKIATISNLLTPITDAPTTLVEITPNVLLSMSNIEKLTWLDSLNSKEFVIKLDTDYIVSIEKYISELVLELSEELTEIPLHLKLKYF